MHADVVDGDVVNGDGRKEGRKEGNCGRKYIMEGNTLWKEIHYGRK